MRITVLLFIVCLAGCTKDVRQAPPAVPEVIYVEQVLYVPIDPSLTKRCTVAMGPLEQIPQVARDRRKQLETCNAQLEAIESIQGTLVKDSQ